MSFQKERRKFKRIEAELIDAKRLICELRDKNHQLSPSLEVEISTVVPLNNVKSSFYDVGDFGPLSTPASAQSSRSAHADAINILCSITKNNIQIEHNITTSLRDADSCINESFANRPERL